MSPIMIRNSVHTILDTALHFKVCNPMPITCKWVNDGLVLLSHECEGELTVLDGIAIDDDVCHPNPSLHLWKFMLNCLGLYM
jgi:hypothetical protein